MTIKGYGTTGRVDYLFSSKLEELENGRWLCEAGGAIGRIIGTREEVIATLVRAMPEAAQQLADATIDPGLVGAAEQQQMIRRLLGHHA